MDSMNPARNAKVNGGQRWKVFLIPAPITLTTSVNQQLTLTWLTVKGTNVSTVLSTFKSFDLSSPISDRTFEKGGRQVTMGDWVGGNKWSDILKLFKLVKR